MSRGNISPFAQLQNEAREVIREVTSQITSKKAELRQLEGQLEQLAPFAGNGRANGAARPARAVRVRIDWSEVLKKLPKEFQASNIRKVRGLKDKRPSELFAAITRWIDSGAVKKKDRGVYLRVEKPQETKSKKAK